ncbi:MAG: flippase [Chitinophagaceae bacterium]|nr:MAG: flippase [Chitinophagaceae bacterium]
MSSLKSKFLYQLAVSFLYSVAPITIFPYISRVLGPENIGKINFIDYTAQFFILFATFGMPLYAVREVSKVRSQPTELNKLISELVILHFIFSFVSLAGFICIIPFLPTDFREKELLIIAGMNILLNAFSIEWLLQGLEDFSFFGKRSFIIKIASVISIFIFVHHSTDYALYYFLLIAANIAILVTDISYAYRKQIRFTFSPKFRRHLAPLTIFFLTSATVSIYTYFDTVILGLISGSLAVGFYTTGLKTIRLTQNFVNDIGGVLMPRMSYLNAMNNATEMNRILNLSLQYILTVSLPIGFFVFLMAPEIINVLAGDAFAGAVPVLRVLSLLPILIGLSNLFGTQILLAFGKEKKVLAGVLGGSIASIAANLILCPLYQEKGAATASIIAESVVTAILGWQAVRLIKFRVSRFFLAGVVLSSGLFLPVVWLLKQTAFFPLIVVIIAGIACFGLYVFLQLFVFKNPIMISLKDFVSTTLLNRKMA